MRPTRKTQPYRTGARQPGPVLKAMRRGRTLYGQNPQDVARATARKRRHKGGLRRVLADRSRS